MAEAKQHHVCPWWIGYLLASPIRRIFQNPEEILSPFIRFGMAVLEPGPGMGFFTIPLARMVGRRLRVRAGRAKRNAGWIKTPSRESRSFIPHTPAPGET